MSTDSDESSVERMAEALWDAWRYSDAGSAWAGVYWGDLAFYEDALPVLRQYRAAFLAMAQRACALRMEDRP